MHLSDILGNDENSLTKSLGLILHYNREALRNFLKLCGISRITETSLNKVQIKTQVNHGKYGITDMELILPKKFYVVIEAKTSTPINKQQLEKYAEFLRKEENDYKTTKLILIAQEKFYGKIKGLSNDQFACITWEEVLDELYLPLNLSSSRLDQDFINYLGEVVMPEEILIVAENNVIDFDFSKKNRLYIYPVEGSFPKRKRALYIAFYTGKGDFDKDIESSVSYIAKIEKIEQMTGKEINEKFGPIGIIDNNNKTLTTYEFPKMSWKEIKALKDSLKENEELLLFVDEEYLDKKYFVIRTGEFIKLPRPIKNRKGVRVTYKFTTFEKLLKAKYYDEL